MPPALRDSPTQALYRAALGPVQSEHHLRAFERFDTLGSAAPSWNWAAALLTLNWLVYRRLWRMAGLYLALVLLAAGLIYGLAWGRLPDGVTLGLAAAVALFATAIPGLYANAWLHSQLRLALVAAAREAPSLADTTDTLRRRAPSLARLGVLALVNLLLGALVASSVLRGAPFGKTPNPATSEAAAPALVTVAVSAPAPAPAASPLLAQASVEAVSVSSAAPAQPTEAVPASPAALPSALEGQATVPAPANPLPTRRGGYFINVGLFADAANAERTVGRIRQAGLPVSADTLALERGPRTRVRAGPFASRAEADRAAARIRALGLEARVVSSARPERPPG